MPFAADFALSLVETDGNYTAALIQANRDNVMCVNGSIKTFTKTSQHCTESNPVLTNLDVVREGCFFRQTSSILAEQSLKK